LIAQLRNEVSNTQTACTQAQEVERVLREYIKSIEDNLSQQVEDLQAERERKKELQNELVASNGDKSKLMSELSKVSNELFVAKEKLALNQDIASSLKQRNESIENSLNAVNQELRTVSAERDSQAAQLKHLADDLSATGERLELNKLELSRKETQSNS